METYVNNTKSVRKVQSEIDTLVLKLRKKGVRFRILAALLSTQSYNIVYKRFVAAAPGRIKGQGRPMADEQAALAEWELECPHLAGAMKKRQITPRAYCCFYNCLTADKKADLTSLFSPRDYEAKRNLPAGLIQKRLEVDFPEIYNISYEKYVVAECNADDHCLRKMVRTNNKLMHCLSSPELEFTIFHESLLAARQLFQKRFYHELRIKRMKMLLESGLKKDDVIEALAWLPAKVDNSKKKNTGEGWEAVRRAERKEKYYNKDGTPPVFC